jgi:hypothetical protein
MKARPRRRVAERLGRQVVTKVRNMTGTLAAAAMIAHPTRRSRDDRGGRHTSQAAIINPGAAAAKAIQGRMP